MRIHGSGVGVAVVAPDFIHQVLPREDFVRVGEQHPQQEIFLPAQRYGTSLVRDGERVRIERAAADLRDGFPHHVAAPEQGLDAKQQFLHINGLRHVVVGSLTESLPFVVERVLCRNDQHRNRKIRAADFGGQLVAVHHGHHQIHDDQMDAGVLHHVKRSGAVLRLVHLVAGAAEVNPHQPAQLRAVLHNQNVRHLPAPFLASV